jgi:alanine dehydrogenase
MVLLITNDEVRSAIDMAQAIDVVEAGFREEAEGGLHQPHRLNMPAGEPGKSFLRIGPCVMHNSGWMGFKAMNLAKDIGVRYQVHLYKMATGELCSIMDGQFLTTLRTGATSGVATRYLARKKPGLVGVLGSGQESMMQLEAMRALGLVSSARIYSPTPEKRESLAQLFRDKHGLDVKAVATPREAVEGCDSVVGAVNSSNPVILGEWLRPGMHINSVGTARPTQREIDHEVFRRAEIIVVDTREGVFKEAGDGVSAAKDGVVDPDGTFELSQLVVGKAPRRTSDEQITLFKSVGTAVQDIAVAAQVYQNALARGLGRDMGKFPYILEKSAQKNYH